MGRDIEHRVTVLENYSLFTFDKDKAKAVDPFKLQVILKAARTNDKNKSETPDDIDRKPSDESVASRQKSVRIVERDESIKPCTKYFDNLEKERNDKTNKIQKLYDSIGPIMIKLESLILGTVTGESDKMRFYYTHWETRVFNSMIRFTTRNLQEFVDKMMHNQPIFEVDAVLAAPEIIMQPTANEVYNIVIQCVKDFLER